MRQLRFFYSRNVLALIALVLAACSGGGARSPDLPFPELLGFSVSCVPAGPLEIGQTSQCSADTNSCRYREYLSSGGTREVTIACPAVTWSASPGSVATINGTGLLTGTGAGTATVTGTIDGVRDTTEVRIVAATLVSANVSCNPNTLNVGQTAQCVVSNCTYTVPGSTTPQTRQCPDATWSASPNTVGSITNAGVFTATGAGTATVTANVGTLTPTTQIQVSGACIQSIDVTPATATVIAGQSQTYVSTARFSNNTFGNVTASTTFSSSNADVASFPAGAGNATASTDAQLATQTNVTVTGSYTGNTCGAGPLTDNATLTVRPGTILANGLCLEAISGSDGFEGCRADTGACTTAPLSLTVGQQRQLRLRARFDSGQECNLTNSAGSSFASSATSVGTVTNTVPPGRGLVTGVAPGDSNLTGSATIGGSTVAAAPIALTVRLNEVLGANSVAVSAKSLANPGAPSKFACVGATDLVGGLTDSSKLQGRQRLFAGARFCKPADVNATTGNCDTFIDGDVYRDVTNDDGVTEANPDANRIVWTQSNGYWNGAACVTTLPALPIGNGPSGLVGDDLTPALRYALGDRRPGENGVVVGAGNLRIGFSCITADYHNPAFPANNDVDGMTVLVLPVTNDVILGSSNDEDATQLCAALEAVFQLGSSPNGGNGVVTQVLSAVTEIVNPILQSLAGGQEPGNEGPIPVDTIVTQLLTALSDPLTSQLFATPLGDLVALLDNTIYAPVLCGVDTLLTAILTANPAAIGDAQLCVPEVPTFPFPFPAP
ncbi:Ig-like domain-containing protein [Solimonas sp. K1W22B-7]|uniref:Ig-like domain-containing protein n=1 Tax=Solimonas sp. K1W22B-7 TaxID=2303331 RepID=UPI0013C4B1B6|nr:Ig-like domain-containing protein [Solimonas sp. K1W22B-7]